MKNRSPIRTVVLSVALGIAQAGLGAEVPFTVTLREVSFAGVPGLQAFAVASTSSSKWLCLGGRTAGLHGHDDGSGASAPVGNFAGGNDRAWVIDIPGRAVTSRRLTDLVPQPVADTLNVTNAEFIQVGDRLYLVGGYGLRSGSATFSTRRRLTVVDVPALIAAIETGAPAGNALRQSAEDPVLQVTGGELGYLGGTFYLVFGQRYDVNYTPGSDGIYTFQVRPFRVIDDAGGVRIVKEAPVGSSSEPEFRRRDFNLVPAIRPDGSPGLTVHGGAFRPFPANTSWTRPIDIDRRVGPASVVLEPTGFEQAFCQYTCPVLPVFSRSGRTTWNVFFGGISEFALDAQGNFRRDRKLPFVDLMSCVRRTPDGRAAEFLLARPGGATGPEPLRLPGLLGASARLIPAGRPPASDTDRVVELDAIHADTVVGYIYGGIVATQGHSGPTSASPRLFAIHLSPEPSPAISVPAGVFSAPERASSQEPTR